jgi:hypothetical protein
VVEMCVFVTVVEPAVTTSKKIRSTEPHIMENLQTEGAMVDRQWVVVMVEGVSKR